MCRPDCRPSYPEGDEDQLMYLPVNATIHEIGVDRRIQELTMRSGDTRGMRTNVSADFENEFDEFDWVPVRTDRFNPEVWNDSEMRVGIDGWLYRKNIETTIPQKSDLSYPTNEKLRVVFIPYSVPLTTTITLADDGFYQTRMTRPYIFNSTTTKKYAKVEE